MRHSGVRRYAESSLSISRGIRYPGKAALDRAAGSASVRAAQDGVEDARHQASLRFADFWITALLGREERQIAEAELAALVRERKALARRVELVDAALLDLHQAQCAESQARILLKQRIRDEATARESLAGAFPELVTELAIAPDMPVPTALTGSMELWEALVADRSHEITMAAWEAETRRLLSDRARQDRWSDPSIGLRVFNERGGEETGVGLFLSKPIGGQRRSALADREAAAFAAARARSMMVDREVRMTARTDVIRARDSHTAWVQAAAAREASLEVSTRMKRGYDLGEKDLSDLLLTQRQMFEAQRLELSARADAQASMVKLLLDAHELWLRE